MIHGNNIITYEPTRTESDNVNSLPCTNYLLTNPANDRGIASAEPRNKKKGQLSTTQKVTVTTQADVTMTSFSVLSGIECGHFRSISWPVYLANLKLLAALEYILKLLVSTAAKQGCRRTQTCKRLLLDLQLPDSTSWRWAGFSFNECEFDNISQVRSQSQWTSTHSNLINLPLQVWSRSYDGIIVELLNFVSC